MLCSRLYQRSFPRSLHCALSWSERCAKFGPESQYIIRCCRLPLLLPPTSLPAAACCCLPCRRLLLPLPSASFPATCDLLCCPISPLPPLMAVVSPLLPAAACSLGCFVLCRVLPPLLVVHSSACFSRRYHLFLSLTGAASLPYCCLLVCLTSPLLSLPGTADSPLCACTSWDCAPLSAAVSVSGCFSRRLLLPQSWGWDACSSLSSFPLCSPCLLCLLVFCLLHVFLLLPLLSAAAVSAAWYRLLFSAPLAAASLGRVRPPVLAAVPCLCQLLCL